MWWTRLKDNILEAELETLRGFQGWSVRAARVVYYSSLKLRADLGVERAATLSFVTILSLIPLGILFFSFADLVGVTDKIAQYVKDTIVPLAAPNFKPDLEAFVDEYFLKQEVFREGLSGWAGFVGILTLIPAALTMMVTAERTLNLIWKTPMRRTYLQRFATFWVVLTTSPFILLASTRVQDLLVPRGGLIEGLSANWFLGAVYHFLVPVSIGFVAFTLVYVYLPATSVKLRHAALGGFVAAALWETSKRCFYLYVERADSLYGRMAIIPLSMVWLYINWLIVFVGCEVAYVAQNLGGMHADRARGPAGQPTQPLTLVGLAYVEAVVRAFLNGEPIATPGQFAEWSNLEVEDVREAAERLERAGLLAETTEEKGGYLPARAPENMGLEEVLDALLDPGEACLIRDAEEGPLEMTPEEEEGGALHDVRSLEILRRSGTAYRSLLREVALSDIVGRPRDERSNGGAL